MKCITPIGLGKLAFPQFTWGKVHRFIQSKIFDMLSGRLPRKRLMVNIGPQHTKSTLMSQVLPAWLVISDPKLKCILLSYDSGLAESHSKAARSIVQEFGKQLTGVQVDQSSKSKGDWRTTEGGGMLATGILGGVTGRSANVLIIDDPFKNQEQADSPTIRAKVFAEFSATAETRLHPDGCIVIICTRWHKEDLVGQLLEHEPEKWTCINLPALAHEDDPLGRAPGEPLLPERYSLEWYTERKAQYEARGQIHIWNSLYDCSPTGDATSLEWPASYLDKSIWIAPDMLPDTMRMRVLALDPSKSRRDDVGDFSAFVDVQLDHENHLYVRSWAQRCPADQVIDIAVSLLKANRYSLFICETNLMQSLFADAIAKEAGRQNIHCPIYHFQNTEDKTVRVRMNLTALLAQRRIHLLSDSPSNAMMLKQLQVFPTGEHDDLPDALSLATVGINHILAGPQNSRHPLVHRV